MRRNFRDRVGNIEMFDINGVVSVLRDIVDDTVNYEDYSRKLIKILNADSFNLSNYILGSYPVDVYTHVGATKWMEKRYQINVLKLRAHKMEYGTRVMLYDAALRQGGNVFLSLRKKNLLRSFLKKSKEQAE